MRYTDKVIFTAFDFDLEKKTSEIRAAVEVNALVIPFSNPPTTIPNENERAEFITIYSEDKWNVYVALSYYYSIQEMLFPTTFKEFSRFNVDIFAPNPPAPNPFKKFVNYMPTEPANLIDSISIYDKYVHMVKTQRGNVF